MIVKMRKFNFLIYHKAYHSFIEKIMDAGVVHINEKQTGIPDDAENLLAFIHTAKRLKHAISYLNKIKLKKVKTTQPVGVENGMLLLEETENLINQQNEINQSLSIAQKEKEAIDVWGHFSVKDLQKLKDNGIYIHFFSSGKSAFNKDWENTYDLLKINQVGSTIYFIILTNENKEINIDANQLKFPEKSGKDREEEIIRLKTERKTIDARLETIATSGMPLLQRQAAINNDNISLSKVVLDTEKEVDDKLMILEGYVPVDKENELVQQLSGETIYYEIETPNPVKEKVPVLLKNNKFARLFEPIGNLYTLPTYKEFDQTACWAPFYMIFFGICLGDAGYGLLLILISLIGLWKLKKTQLRSYAKLLLFLGIGAAVFGFVGGAFFGIQLLDVSYSWFAAFKNIIFNSDQMFMFALVLGLIHLSFAMMLKGIFTTIQFGFKYALATWGWLLVITGNITAFALSHFEIISPVATKYTHISVTATGLFFFLFMNNPDKNIVANFGGGLWNLYNGITGLLGDVLSYIRLFALSLSGSVLGLVFNMLAVSLAPSIPVLHEIVVVVIFLFGHTLNLFMSGLGAFVHPMRLTFVEFFNNSGFEGEGKKYNPLKRESV